MLKCINLPNHAPRDIQRGRQLMHNIFFQKKRMCLKIKDCSTSLHKGFTDNQYKMSAKMKLKNIIKLHVLS